MEQANAGSPDSGEEMGWGLVSFFLLEHQTGHPQFSYSCSWADKPSVSFARCHLHISFLTSLKQRWPSHPTQPVAQVPFEDCVTSVSWSAPTTRYY